MASSPFLDSKLRYRPTVFLATCVLVGVLALLVAALSSTLRWPALATAAASQLALACACFWPRAGLLGPNLTRLPVGEGASISLTFDDGPDPEVTPQVLKVLAAARAQATFFLIGDRAQRHPELVREILRHGHTLANHTHRHRWYFATLPPTALGREIDLCQAVLQGFLSEAGAAGYFRPPAGFQSPLLAFQLARRGLTLATWTRRGFDTADGNPERVLEKLSKGLGPGDILLLHDGNSARTVDGHPVVLEVLPQLLDLCRQRNLSVLSLPAQGPL